MAAVTTHQVAGSPAAAVDGAPLAARLRPGFEGYRDQLIHEWLRTLTKMGAVLYPAFWILDNFIIPPQSLSQVTWYRVAVTVGILGLYFVIRATRPSRLSYLYGYVLSFLTAGGIVLMTRLLGGFDSGYYAGLNLVIVAVNVMLPWRAIHSAINGALVIALYVIANVNDPDYTAAHVINNLYFMGGTVVIAVAINHVKYLLIRQEYFLREEILKANENLESSRVALKQARDALWGEMEVAQRIQTALLPRNRRLGAYEVAATMIPATEVGGDYYDFIEAPDGQTWVAVGDVSGHGVEAGLVMMMTQTSILSLVSQNPSLSPAEVFTAVNSVMRENISRLQAGKYMTLNLIRLEPDRLTVAGKHQDIYIYRRASQTVDLFENQGVWIGVVPDATKLVQNEQVALSEGDTVLLYTDGVTEAVNDAGQMYGDERLAEAFRKVAERPLEEALATLHSEITRFSPKQEDDITLVLLRRLPVN